MSAKETHVVQVTNVSPTVTKDQLKSFFSFVGKIEDIKLYPESEAIDVSTRVCYVKYKDPEDVNVALHLTNTVFVDRALIVVSVSDDKIPDELTALGLGGSEGANLSNMYQGLAQYPVLPANTDLSKVEEIRRTIYIGNIDGSLSPEVLMQFFTQAGEIKYMRMAGEESLSIRNAFIEYTDQNSVIKALGLNGHTLAGHQIRITPSNSAIVKPPIMPGVSATTKDIEEAMKKVSEAESMISAVADNLTNGRVRSRSHRRSRSRKSRSRRRSRSRGSRSRKRSRSRSGRSRYRSRSRRRSRSHKRSRKSGSRSRRSRSKSSRSRSRDRKRDRRSSRSRKSSKDRKSDDVKSKKSTQSRDASTSSKLGREGSEHSRESRTSKKKSSKRKSDSVSRGSRSRSVSRKAKKSRRDDEKKSRRDEKEARKHKRDSDRHSGKELSSTSEANDLRQSGDEHVV